MLRRKRFEESTRDSAENDRLPDSRMVAAYRLSMVSEAEHGFCRDVVSVVTDSPPVTGRRSVYFGASVPPTCLSTSDTQDLVSLI